MFDKCLLWIIIVTLTNDSVRKPQACSADLTISTAQEEDMANQNDMEVFLKGVLTAQGAGRWTLAAHPDDQGDKVRSATSRWHEERTEVVVVAKDELIRLLKTGYMPKQIQQMGLLDDSSSHRGGLTLADKDH